ncbi:MAG: hypothetical protein E7225_05825 [Clostridiales bacterium]|nr:hypothetical protein [Clostridiales bacterium]
MEDRYEILSVTYNTPDGNPEPMVNMERLFALAGVDLTAMNPDEENEELDKLYSLFGECYAETSDKFEYKVCYTAVGYAVREDREIDIDFAQFKSEDLLNSLLGCEYVVPFAVTLGSNVHEFIRDYKTDDPKKKQCMIALAYERLFTLCDAFGDDLNAVVRQEGRTLKPFLQPGDGDFPAELRTDFVRVLNTEKEIGLKMNEDGSFDPVLSVTGIFCVTEAGTVAPYDDCAPELCATCGNTDCPSRQK